MQHIFWRVAQYKYMYLEKRKSIDHVDNSRQLSNKAILPLVAGRGCHV